MDPSKPGAYADKNGRVSLEYRQQLDRAFDDIWRERQTHEGWWRTVAEFMAPDAVRFLASDHNKGNKSRVKILKSTAVRAWGIARAALLAGMASPSRPWFALGTPLGVEQTDKASRAWLDELRMVTLDVMDRSNYYNSTGGQIGDELRFATSPKIIFEDEDKVIRSQVFPIGSYAIAQSNKGVADTLAREFTMTVRQVVDEFGEDRISERVRRLWNGPRQRHQDAVQVRHLIQPNRYADDERGAVDARYLPWKECYWETGGSGASGSASRGDEATWGSSGGLLGEDRLLREGGYHEFPGSIARWDKNDDDVWGTSCPGRDALGDVMQLMSMVRRRANAVAKMVDPPLLVDPSLDNEPVSLLAGARTSGSTAGGAQGGSVRPIHEVRISLAELNDLIAETVDDIKDSFLVSILLSMLGSTRTQPLTAEQTRAIVNERNQVIGPILERHSDDVFDRDLNRITGIILRRSALSWAVGEPGLVSPPPESLQGQEIRVEYTSEFAQGQKIIGLQGVERLLQTAMAIEQVVPGTMDKVDVDHILDEISEMMSLDPETIRDDEVVAGIRQQRQQAAQMEQLSQALPSVAGAARDMSGPVDESSALAALMGGG